MSIDPTRIDIAVDPQRQRLIGVSAHGLKHFDVPYISEIVPGLWLGGCEDGLVLPRFIKHLVSLYPWESYTVNHESGHLAGGSDVRQPRPDLPSGRRHRPLGESSAGRPGPVLVHCQAGFNRSSLVVTRALVLERMPVSDAIALVREKRSPVCLCNPSFERWLLAQVTNDQMS